MKGTISNRLLRGLDAQSIIDRKFQAGRFTLTWIHTSTHDMHDLGGHRNCPPPRRAVCPVFKTLMWDWISFLPSDCTEPCHPPPSGTAGLNSSFESRHMLKLYLFCVDSN